MITFTLVSIFPHYKLKPVRADFVLPTLSQDINGYRVNVPNWDKISLIKFILQSDGTIPVPPELAEMVGYSQIVWRAGQSLDEILRLGQVSSAFHLEKLALQQISEITGIDIKQLSLNNLDLMNWQTLESLTKAIPGLGNIPISRIKLIKDVVSQMVVDGDLSTIVSEIPKLTLGDIIYELPSVGNIPLGTVVDLGKYSFEDIPGLSLTSLDKFADWGKSLISQVPGLNLVPFSLFPIGFNLGATKIALMDLPWSDAEEVDGNAVQLYLSEVPPVGAANSYVELSDPLGEVGEYYGKRIAGCEHKVEGGEGILKETVPGTTDRECPGVFPFGRAFAKMVASEISEPNGSAKFSFYFRICIDNPIDLGCTAFFLGPVEWVTVTEGETIVMGGPTAPKINIPNDYQQQINDTLAQHQHSPNMVEVVEVDCSKEPGKSTGQFINPLFNGTIVTSGFGYRKNPVTGRDQNHSGIDLGAGMGTPAKAADGGIVTFINRGCPDFGNSRGKIGCGGRLGNYVDIQHSTGIKTRSGHFKQGSIAVKVGEKVCQGQQIARVGNSGRSSGPHLHFEVHLSGGRRVNPAPYLPGLRY
ncbi:MAG: M23 family metallopeptidase [Prochloraceae cyanobacterium]|nr:M23 family metallopeptidase [Prochloraceae cyanobacterium]